GGVVGPGVLFGGIARVGGDLVGNRPHLGADGRAVGWVPHQLVDPGPVALALLQVVFDEQLSEEHADADVREGAKRQQAARGVDERTDLGIVLLYLLDDAADRLVAQRDPDVLAGHHHGENTANAAHTA